MKQSDLFSFPEIQIRRNRGQKTLRMRVRSDGVLLSAPNGVSQRDIQVFIEKNRHWLEKQLEKQHKLKLDKEELQKRMQKECFISGCWKPYRVVYDSTVKKALFREEEETVVVETGQLVREFHKEIIPWMKKEAKKRLQRLLDEEAVRMDVAYMRLTIRSQKRRWGSCSSKGGISLNWRLIRCPEFVQRYIIVHELAHRIVFNHSKSYWRVVERWYPGFKEAESWIRENGRIAFTDYP